MDLQKLRERKRKWAETLEVGDIVEDCRCRELRIVEVNKEWSLPRWFYIYFFGYTPLWMHGFLEAVAWKILPISYWDSQLKLEDGAHCSVMHCCDPASGDTSEFADYTKSPEYLRMIEEFEKSTP